MRVIFNVHAWPQAGCVAYLTTMRSRLHNPYAQPFYFSVALAFAGIVLLGVTIEDYTGRA